MVQWKKIKEKEDVKNWLNVFIFILFIINAYLIYSKDNKETILKSKIGIVSAKSGLKLRKTPNGNAILNIPFKQKVEIIDSNQNSEWIRVSYNNSVGYVKKDYLN